MFNQSVVDFVISEYLGNNQNCSIVLIHKENLEVKQITNSNILDLMVLYNGSIRVKRICISNMMFTVNMYGCFHYSLDTTNVSSKDIDECCNEIFQPIIDKIKSLTINLQ